MIVPYLPELLHQAAQVLAVSLCTGGSHSTVIQFQLELQETTPKVGLLGGRLLQQCLLIVLPVLCDLTLGGVCLAECLEQDRRGKDYFS